MGNGNEITRSIVHIGIIIRMQQKGSSVYVHAGKLYSPDQQKKVYEVLWED
jgi:hypothetical protein